MEENTVPDLNKKRSKSQKLGPPAKKNKLEQTDENSFYNYKTNKNEYSLLDFSDDVLLEILKNLNTGDLINLGQSCTRLEQLIRDRTLWGNVDLRTSDINGSSLKDYVNYLLPNTKSFAVKGCEAAIINQNVARRLYNEPEGNERVNTSGIHRPVNENVQAELLLENLNGATLQRDVVENICKIAPNIEEFIVENHFIDGLELLLEHFPSNLIHLSLKDCCVYRLPDNKSYFFGFHEKFPKIECLDLTNCLWYTCHSFFALSKSKTLKKLILYGCSQIYNCVPYISLAFRIGFNSLTKSSLEDRGY
uniref:F-box domain-containing protein n=1 Tax=Clastoptera arizonana TaxID=38151 RepID=A0A1B6D9M2_9HEMI